MRPNMRVFLISFSMDIGSSFQLKGRYNAICRSIILRGITYKRAPKRSATIESTICITLKNVITSANVISLLAQYIYAPLPYICFKSFIHTCRTLKQDLTNGLLAVTTPLTVRKRYDSERFGPCVTHSMCNMRPDLDQYCTASFKIPCFNHIALRSTPP